MTIPAGLRNSSQPSVPGRLISVFAFLLLCAMALYYFLHSPVFGVREVIIEGNECLRSEEVVQLTGVILGTNIFLIDEEQIKRRLQIHPLLDTATIERRLPDKLWVRIQERTPFALIPVPEGGFMAIDPQGVYLTRVGNIVEINRPVITGCAIPSDILPGQPLSVSILAQFLPIMEQTSPAVQLAISEINLSQPENIRIYTLNGIEIRVGTLEHLSEYLGVLEEILTVQINRFEYRTVEYIDMSFRGSPVIKFYSE